MFESNQINLKELWVDESYDLSTHRNYKVIDSIAENYFENKIPKTTLIRPRNPIPSGKNRKLHPDSPLILKRLFNVAYHDMHRLGLNPNDYKLYPLFQSGWVKPSKCLRAGFWHFDLMRNLKLPVPKGKMAFSIGYSVMNTLPTMFVNDLRESHSKALPARKTIENETNQLRLGEIAQNFNRISSPFKGEVVRYDSMTLHRGRPNTSNEAIYRVFANLSFTK